MHYHRVTRVCNISNGAQDTPLGQLFLISFYLRFIFSERTRFIFVRFFCVIFICLASFFQREFVLIRHMVLTEEFVSLRMVILLIQNATEKLN